MTREQRQKRKDYLREHRRYDFVNIWQRRYAHMKARHDGKATHFSHCEGKGLLSREEFFEWCKDFSNLNVFIAIYFDWAEADFPLGLSPSIDRIDPTLGYVDGNLQWLTFDQNSTKNHWYIDPITKKKVREAVPA
jgi:hypothetical protein